MLRLMTVAGAAMMIAGAAQAEEWMTLPEGRNVIVAVDRSSIRTSGSDKVFWSVFLAKTVREDGFRHMLTQYSLNCERETSRTLATVFYKEDGSVMETSANPATDSPIPPGTMMSQILAAVCHDGWPAGGYGIATIRDWVELTKAMIADGVN